ncbi:MAG: hypothetical protein H0T79_10960, partial [Deltaproteobacteria bacterium]|nr:hypothetical protein [Deltaproteobacteria bacterium]
LTALSLAAHRVWFQPTDLRCTEGDLGRVTSVAEALAADIVCVHAPLAITRAQLRRGTHVNVLVACDLDPELAAFASVTHEVPGLGLLAAGLVDGRQLDELTLFVLGDALIARAAT